MAIQKRVSRTGKTRWVARYRDPAGKERSKTFDTQKAAKIWLSEKQRDMARGQWIDPTEGTVTLGALFGEWQEAATRTDTANVRAYTKSNLGVLADMPIQTIRRSHIQTWVNGLADGTGSVSGKPLSPITVRTCLKHVSTVLSQAVFDRLISVSPAQRIHTEPVSGAVEADKIPTPSDVEAIIESAKGLRRKNADVLVMLLAATGMRSSEACGLTKGDVDFLRRRIRIRRQRSQDGTVAPLKTLSARRDVYLPEPLALRLSPLCDGDPNDPIFTNGDGAPWTRRSVSSIFHSIRRRTGMLYTAHSMRHFYASGLIAHGVDVRSVQAALGHASATVTLSTYAHLWPDSESRTASAGDSLMRDICGIEGKDGGNGAVNEQVRGG